MEKHLEEQWNNLSVNYILKLIIFICKQCPCSYSKLTIWMSMLNSNWAFVNEKLDQGQKKIKHAACEILT